jgi:hypothetical protein
MLHSGYIFFAAATVLGVRNGRTVAGSLVEHYFFAKKRFSAEKTKIVSLIFFLVRRYEKIVPTTSRHFDFI